MTKQESIDKLVELVADNGGPELLDDVLRQTMVANIVIENASWMVPLLSASMEHAKFLNEKTIHTGDCQAWYLHRKCTCGLTEAREKFTQLTKENEDEKPATPADARRADSLPPDAVPLHPGRAGALPDK